MWGLFSRDPTSHFQYEIGDEVWREESRCIWRLHKGKKKQNGEEVSVFICESTTGGGSGGSGGGAGGGGGASGGVMDLARAAVKKLKTLRHPCVLTFMDSLENERLVYLVTEPVTPLMCWLRQNTHPTPALAWGLLQITKALAFLNNEGGLTHHTVNSISVFVTQAGDWKLSGVECCSSVATPPTPGSRPVPALQVYSPPEASTNSTPSNKWSSDMWGLGCLVWETFNTTTLTESTTLRDTTKIPPGLVETYTRLVGASARCRPNPKDVLATLTKKGAFFHNDLILTLTFLEELHIKDDTEKTRFVSDLSGKLDEFPDYISKYKILPSLLAAHSLSGFGAVILGPLFKIGTLLNDCEYQQHIVPCVVTLFSSSDRNTRLKLLQQIPSLCQHITTNTVNKEVFPHLVSGFVDTNATIREHTVKSILYLADKLNYNNLNIDVLNHFARLQSRDDQGGIRTNTTVCLGKVASHLHPDVRQKCLVSAFTRATKDPFPPARVAGIMAMAATQQYYPIDVTAKRILPTLCLLTVDSDNNVRESAFKVIKGFLSKLEKVSQDPILKEEMEREIRNQSGVVGAPSSWAGWAVGALASKFYKSNITHSTTHSKFEDPPTGPTTRPPPAPTTGSWGQTSVDSKDFFDTLIPSQGYTTTTTTTTEGWDDWENDVKNIGGIGNSGLSDIGKTDDAKREREKREGLRDRRT
ncbi:hypothetical protein Pcinc_036539 [Petrolisthes cinctipes]|uniref:N-terminal kinase-like protein n=1 Tax=Petrolisthes cinctipes TaxID=88211 RepID=A0AAE1BUS3_PETCI|nr:hypothetical protein Pcinc_036539 [Petrolisthes cinctipes]KAK3857195.1 hypothetical protein Pcinc_036539 [Petrolisthes cinctipes]